MKPSILDRYGTPLADFPFEVVTLHHLSDNKDEHTASHDIRLDYCDVYWKDGDFVAFLAIAGSKPEAFASYSRRKDCPDAPHSFFIATRRTHLDRKFLLALLKRLRLWRQHNSRRWSGRGSSKSMVIFHGEVD